MLGFVFAVAGELGGKTIWQQLFSFGGFFGAALVVALAAGEFRALRVARFRVIFYV